MPELCSTMPTRSRRSRSRAAGSWPSTRDVAAAAAAVALEDLDRRRLARAVGPEQPEDLAAAHLEVDAAHGLVLAVGLVEVAAPRSRSRGHHGKIVAAANALRLHRHRVQHHARAGRRRRGRRRCARSLAAARLHAPRARASRAARSRARRSTRSPASSPSSARLVEQLGADAMRVVATAAIRGGRQPGRVRRRDARRAAASRSRSSTARRRRGWPSCGATRTLGQPLGGHRRRRRRRRRLDGARDRHDAPRARRGRRPSASARACSPTPTCARTRRSVAELHAMREHAQGGVRGPRPARGRRRGGGRRQRGVAAAARGRGARRRVAAAGDARALGRRPPTRSRAGSRIDRERVVLLPAGLTVLDAAAHALGAAAADRPRRAARGHPARARRERPADCERLRVRSTALAIGRREHGSNSRRRRPRTRSTSRTRRSTSTASCRGWSSTTACSSSPRTRDVPLLERLKFSAIASNNLDEFFMVRVAGLHDQVDAGIETPLQDGRTPRETLDAIRAHRRASSCGRQARCLRARPAARRWRSTASASSRLDEVSEQRARAARRALPAPDLPGPDAARRRARAAVPLHLEPLAVARRRRPRPADAHAGLRAREGADGDAPALRAARRRPHLRAARGR